MKHEPHIVNRKARHDYFIEEEIEAGLILKGCEVKNIRDHKCSLEGSYAVVDESEAWLLGMHIDRFRDADPDPRRPRKLLLKRREINRLSASLQRDGMTLVPLEIVWKWGKVKVMLGLAKGKRQHDKREMLKLREARREIRHV